jgi:pentatricopeptide repeat protein
MVHRLELPVDPELVAQIQKRSDHHQRQSSKDGREDAGTLGVSADDDAELAGAKEVVFGVQQTPEMRDFTESCTVRLIRARDQKNFHLAQLVKHEVLEMAERNANDGQPLPPIELYEHLMLNFLLLAHPKTAMEVWETMLQSGFSPTVKTYTVMVRGARACHDVNGMKAFWERMRNAGIQPDLPAWTAFIHGLIKLRNVDVGLEAVKEMGREWLAAAQKQASLDQRAASGPNVYSPPASKESLLAKYPSSIRGVPRPDVTILNCAITALADTTRESAVSEVVSWAQTFAIEPDLITYNTLLNLAMRRKQTKNATALLARMRDRGITPNGDTWVVLLTSMFYNGFLDEVPRDKQLDKVLTWVNSTKDANGRTAVDGKAFALIINQFVKQLKNPDAATGVLAYMAKNDIKFSVHMATIVLTSYFEEEPPNFQAIDDLYQRLLNGDLNGGGSLRTKGPMDSLDTVFYDRLIEGYARYHSIIGLKPCLDILNRCQREGRKNGWRALEQVARAMAAKDRFDLLTDLVISIRARLKQGRGGTQMQGQYDFWNFIISTGILQEEGIRRPEDLLPRNGPRPSPLLDGLSSDVEVVD